MSRFCAKKERWGFAPNPTRELSSLDLPSRFAAVLITSIKRRACASYRTVDKMLFSPEGGRIALSANERIAEFLNIAIQAKFAYVNKLIQTSAKRRWGLGTGPQTGVWGGSPNRSSYYAMMMPPSLAYIEESAEVGVITISPIAGHFSRIIALTCSARSGQLQ